MPDYGYNDDLNFDLFAQKAYLDGTLLLPTDDGAWVVNSAPTTTPMIPVDHWPALSGGEKGVDLSFVVLGSRMTMACWLDEEANGVGGLTNSGNVGQWGEGVSWRPADYPRYPNDPLYDFEFPVLFGRGLSFNDESRVSGGGCTQQSSYELQTMDVDTSSMGSIIKIQPMMKAGSCPVSTGDGDPCFSVSQPSGDIRFLASDDSGTTYYAWDGSSWNSTATSAIFSSGMTWAQVSATTVDWSMFVTSGTIRFYIGLKFQDMFASGKSDTYPGYIHGIIIHYGDLTEGVWHKLVDFSAMSPYSMSQCPSPILANGWCNQVIYNSELSTPGISLGANSAYTSVNGSGLTVYAYTGTKSERSSGKVSSSKSPIVTTPVAFSVNKLRCVYADDYDQSILDTRFAISFNGSNIGAGDHSRRGMEDAVSSVAWKVYRDNAWTTIGVGAPYALCGLGDDWPSSAMTKDEFEAASGFKDELDSGDGTVTVAMWLAYGGEETAVSPYLGSAYISSIEFQVGSDSGEGGDDDGGDGASGSSTPQADLGGPADDQSGAREVKSMALGHRGGRLMRWSEKRSEPKPTNATVRGLLVESYDDGQSTGSPYIIAKPLDSSGNSVYFGPSFSSGTVNSWNKMWPRSDWTRGMTAFIYDSSSSESGAMGQYNWMMGRPYDHPRKFFLQYPFAVAPEEDDVFAIAVRPFWIVFGDVVADPQDGYVTFRNGAIEIEEVSGDPRFRLEVYPAANQLYSTAKPGGPYKPSTPAVDRVKADMQDRGLVYFNLHDPSGLNTQSRHVAIGIADLVDSDYDFRLITAAYEVMRESRG